MKNLFLCSLLVLLAAACQTQKTDQQAALMPEPEATSFAGKPLYPKSADTVVVRKADSIIAILQAKQEPSEDDYIEMGKQYVASQRYRMAVATYTEGLKQFPESYKLLRYRGHRYITLRQLDDAIADLEKASKLLGDGEDVFETDAAGKPTATYRHQIWYHIGVYHFLTKDYAAASRDFENALAATHENTNIMGASDWLYNCYMRSGQAAKTTALLEPFNKKYAADSTHAYFRRLLLYKGIIKPEELIDENMAPETMSVMDVTKLYGLANWYAYHDNHEKANSLYWKILGTKNWEAFAYAASEKEIDGTPPKH